MAVVYAENNYLHRNIADWNLRLLSAARQLASQLPTLSATLQRALAKFSDTDDDELESILRILASELGTVFIVFDGIVKATAKSLNALMRVLKRDHAEKASFQVLITSRDPAPGAFTKHFEASLIEARASGADLKAFVASELRGALRGLSPLEFSEANTMLGVRLSDTCNGVYLQLLPFHGTC